MFIIQILYLCKSCPLTKLNCNPQINTQGAFHRGENELPPLCMCSLAEPEPGNKALSSCSAPVLKCPFHNPFSPCFHTAGPFVVISLLERPLKCGAEVLSGDCKGKKTVRRHAERMSGGSIRQVSDKLLLGMN